MDMKRIVHSAVDRWRRKQQSLNITCSTVRKPERTTLTCDETPKETPVSVVPVTAPAQEQPVRLQEQVLPAPSQPELPKAALLDEKIKRFLDERCRLRFNMLTEVTEVCFSHETSFRTVDARTRNALCLEAHRYGVDCWDRDLSRVIESLHVSEYHPFHDYFRNLPAWDGKDRMTELASRVSDSPQWLRHFHRWMLGVAAQWAGMNDGLHAQSVAPLLVSDEQGFGKSTFCRALMPPELAAYYTDNVNLAQQDTVARLLVETGLINLDEFDRIPASRQPLLKNLMQLSALNIRRAYRTHASRLPRVASFIGTSNSRDLLTDPTGSRRFICVSVRRPIRTDGIDHTQIYAQLKEELQRGERYWFDKEEEAEIQHDNLSFYRSTPLEEVFRHCFRTPRSDERGTLLSLPELHAMMRHRCPGVSGEIKMGRLARTLAAAGVKRTHTKSGNRYAVIEV